MKLKGLLLFLPLLAFAVFAQESNDNTDFLNKVRETPAEKTETSTDKSSLPAETVSPAPVEKDRTPARSTRKKRTEKPVSKKIKTEYSTAEWLESISDVNDDYLLGKKTPEKIIAQPEAVKQDSKQEDSLQTTSRFIQLFDDLGKYKKALIIIGLLIVFAIYRMRTGGRHGGGGGGSKRTPVTINKSINKYRN